MLSAIPTVFFVVFLFIGPEALHYLVSINEIEKAEKVLMQLRSRDRKEVQIELESIRQHLKRDEDGHFTDIFRSKGLRKALTICLVLIIAQQLCGFCTITFYLQPIFETVGARIPPDISALIVGLSMLGSSFFPLFLVDRAGRRILTIYSCFGMFISLSIIGLFFYLKDSTDINVTPFFFVLILSLIFFILSFNFGICSVPWTLTSEMFPNNVKHISASVVTCTCWITSFVVTKFFNDMNDAMGRSGTFWFFAGSCLFTGIFSIVYIPETKGKSFREIQDMLNGVEYHEEDIIEKEEMLDISRSEILY